MLWLAVAVVIAGHVPATGVERARSRTIYLNRDGASLHPGRDDSRTQSSSQVPRLVDIAPWDVTEPQWAEVVECVRNVWSRFDVEVTDIDPQTRPHIEAVFAASATDLDLPATIGGVAPFANDCGVVENAIVFAFTKSLPANPRRICEVISQEIGHSYGLDHELEAGDPMSYLPFTGEREFHDVAAQCGETVARPCGCRDLQNSVAILRERLGTPGLDDEAPALAMTSPLDGERVDPGFDVTITATDDHAVQTVNLYVDGILVSTAGPEVDRLPTRDDLAPGQHRIRVEASDASGTVAHTEITVEIAEDPAVGCSTSGPPGGVTVLAALALALRRRQVARRRRVV